MSPENEVSYEELPPVPNLFDHPAPAASVGAEMFNEAPPFDSLPDPIPPTYGDNYEPAINIPEIYNDDLLMRNRADNMFSIVYDPKPEDKKPSVMYSAGIIVDNNEVTEVGGKPGTLHKVDSKEEAPLDEDLVWYLNVQSNRSASNISSVKDSSADFSIPLAKTTKGHNGYIQQLHRGAVFIGGGGKNFWDITASSVSGEHELWKVKIALNGATVTNSRYLIVPGDIISRKEISMRGTGQYLLVLDYQYTLTAEVHVTESWTTSILKYTEPKEGDKDPREPVQKMITDDITTGTARVVLALFNVTRTGKGPASTLSIKTKQLINQSLRQIWIPGYYEEDSSTGDIKHGAACFLDITVTNPMTAFPF